MVKIKNVGCGFCLLVLVDVAALPEGIKKKNRTLPSVPPIFVERPESLHFRHMVPPTSTRFGPLIVGQLPATTQCLVEIDYRIELRLLDARQLIQRKEQLLL